jgi:tetratricopeptide (TPR) repeat protein
MDDNLDETQPVPPHPPKETMPDNENLNLGEPDPGLTTKAGFHSQDTEPIFIPQPTAPVESQPVVTGDKPPRKRSKAWVVWSAVGIALLAVIALGSGYLGYLSAIDKRTSYESTQVAGEAQTQFNLGMKDFQEAHYELARQRFEYVIQLDPAFPGVTDMLANVLLAMNTTATPTLVPTPTLTPTPDLRGQEELFIQAQTYLLSEDWSAAVDTLLSLRKKFPDYYPVKVDGMLFVALRNRGVQKISSQADLEGGIYDLALAERFGPIDVEASNWRDWAELYIRGASYWDVDWAQAVEYFRQLALIAPNMMDASHITAQERYRLALVGYGDWYARQEMWCEAQQKYADALGLRADAGLEPTATYAQESCIKLTPSATPAQPTGTPTPTPTPTPTLPGETPQQTPTPTLTQPVLPTPTPTLTAAPTETPTLTETQSGG